jgi:hypothetical protein
MKTQVYTSSAVEHYFLPVLLLAQENKTCKKISINIVELLLSGWGYAEMDWFAFRRAQ